MGSNCRLLTSDFSEKTPLFYASALHERHCNNFITVVRSRNKRSPQWGWNDDATSTAGVTTTAVTSAGSTTAAPTTQAPSTTASMAVDPGTTVSTAAPDTTQPGTTEASTTAGGYSTTVGVEGEGTDYLILL